VENITIVENWKLDKKYPATPLKIIDNINPLSLVVVKSVNRRLTLFAPALRPMES